MGTPSSTLAKSVVWSKQATLHTLTVDSWHNQDKNLKQPTCVRCVAKPCGQTCTFQLLTVCGCVRVAAVCFLLLCACCCWVFVAAVRLLLLLLAAADVCLLLLLADLTGHRLPHECSVHGC